jgi:hypothetical protein
MQDKKVEIAARQLAGVNTQDRTSQEAMVEKGKSARRAFILPGGVRTTLYKYEVGLPARVGLIMCILIIVFPVYIILIIILFIITIW